MKVSKKSRAKVMDRLIMDVGKIDELQHRIADLILENEALKAELAEYEKFVTVKGDKK